MGESRRGPIKRGILMLTLTGLCCSVAAGDRRIDLSARRIGAWSAPINVGSPLNTQYHARHGSNRRSDVWRLVACECRTTVEHSFQRHYAVLQDELTIYFTSDRPGSLGDDLWFATRESVDSPWRAAEHGAQSIPPLPTRCRSFPPMNTFCTSTARVRRGAAARVISG
jgi:hypothetical protein